MARDFGERPINRQAARGMSYGPGEPSYTKQQPLPGSDDFLLTHERHHELRREGRKVTNKKAKAARHAARKPAVEKGSPTT